MVGRGSVAALMGAALLMMGTSATAFAQDEPRMVMVTGTPAMIEALEGKGYDVGFVGELNEAGVYRRRRSRRRILRAEGYKIGQTVEDESSRLAVKAQIAETTEGEALAAEVAKNGLTKSAKAKGAVNLPGNVMIQRAYTFTNYAGPLPLRRGAQQAARRHHRPGDVVHVHEPERHVAGLQPVQQHRQPGRRRRRDRRQQDR